jgi:hypothetical protein
VDDAGVVAGLVRRDLGLLVEHREAEARALLQKAARRREAEDARADDDDVIRPRPLHAASLYDRAA